MSQWHTAIKSKSFVSVLVSILGTLRKSRQLQGRKTVKNVYIIISQVIVVMVWKLTQTPLVLNICPRFRQFVFTKVDRKVLDVDTPDGGLVAEFEHLVWHSWSLDRSFWSKPRHIWLNSATVRSTHPSKHESKLKPHITQFAICLSHFSEASNVLHSYTTR